MAKDAGETIAVDGADEQRYCTQCGALTTRQKPNLYTCENGHENWLNPSPGAMVYIIKDDRVLFGVRSIEPGIGLLDVPGGFINPEETAEQAVARETKEEVGVDITLRHILGTYSSMYFGKRALSIVFVADYSGGEPSGSDDMSGGEIVWRDINNLPGAEELSWDWQTACQADLATWWQSQQ